MGARQRAWAARVRDGLLDLLGRRCAWCQRTEPEVKLTFDCIVPTRDGPNGHHRRYDVSWRMSFYRAQVLAGNLQVLCLHCNSAKGATVTTHENELPDAELPPLVTAVGEPF